MLFIEINSLYLIYSNNRYKTKDMNLNIKGIINLDFRGFKSGKELYEFSKNGDNFDTLANVWSTEDENTIINYETLYEKFDEIWVLNNYIIAKRTINSDEIIINPDFTRYLLENSFNYLEEYKKEEKKTKKERTPTKPSMSLNVAIEDEERRKTPIKKKALMTSTSKALSMKPKLGKMSFVDAFFLPGELERVKRKSREWGAAAWSARGDTTKDEDFEEVRRKRDIQKQLLSEWHQTVEKFRDDYKAKRKAAVRRSKRLGGKVFDGSI